MLRAESTPERGINEIRDEAIKATSLVRIAFLKNKDDNNRIRKTQNGSILLETQRNHQCILDSLDKIAGECLVHIEETSSTTQDIIEDQMIHCRIINVYLSLIDDIQARDTTGCVGMDGAPGDHLSTLKLLIEELSEQLKKLSLSEKDNQTAPPKRADAISSALVLEEHLMPSQRADSKPSDCGATLFSVPPVRSLRQQENARDSFCVAL